MITLNLTDAERVTLVRGLRQLATIRARILESSPLDDESGELRRLANAYEQAPGDAIVMQPEHAERVASALRTVARLTRMLSSRSSKHASNLRAICVEIEAKLDDAGRNL